LLTRLLKAKILLHLSNASWRSRHRNQNKRRNPLFSQTYWGRGNLFCVLAQSCMGKFSPPRGKSNKKSADGVVSLAVTSTHIMASLFNYNFLRNSR
jgi:hypothetical protein